MKGLTWQGKETVSYDEVPEPVLLEPTDALVKVSLTAICGSDLHAYHERETGLDRGTVMGHEFTGEVVETGSQVKTIKKGELVACPFTTSCGDCFYCRQGMTCRCPSGELFGWVEKGRGLHGGQGEMVRVPLADSTLLPVDDGIGAEEALLLGDVISTGAFCADMAEVSPPGVFVVLGCGPVGLMSIVGARERGAENIYAVDTLPERLELARRFGAVPLHLEKDEPLATIRERTEGRGADGVLEAVGSPAASRLAVDLVRPGGVVAAAGVHNEAGFAFAPIEVYDKNLTYRSGRCPARYYMERLTPMVRSGRYDLASIISHRLPLKEGPEGYRLFAGRRDQCTKVVLTLP